MLVASCVTVATPCAGLSMTATSVPSANEVTATSPPATTPESCVKRTSKSGSLMPVAAVLTTLRAYAALPSTVATIAHSAEPSPDTAKDKPVGVRTPPVFSDTSGTERSRIVGSLRLMIAIWSADNTIAKRRPASGGDTTIDCGAPPSDVRLLRVTAAAGAVSGRRSMNAISLVL